MPSHLSSPLSKHVHSPRLSSEIISPEKIAQVGNHFQALPQLFLCLHLAPLGKSLGKRQWFGLMLSIPVTYPDTYKPTGGSKHRARAAPDSPPLFDDTSGGYSSQPGGYPAPGADVAFNVNHLLGDPVANMAVAYGSSIASHGKDMVHKEVWPSPRARVAGFWPGLGHHGIPPNPHSSPQGRSTQRSTLRFGVQLAHSLLSPLPAAPFCVCEQTQVFFCCGHSLCG